MRFRDGLLDGLAVGHAAGQVRHGHQEPATLVAGEWFDADGIVLQSHCAQSNDHDLEWILRLLLSQRFMKAYAA